MNRTWILPSGNSRQGMALLEVLIALTIFAVVAFSLVMALDASFDAAKARNEVDTAIRGLDNQMALLHEGRVDPVDKDLPDDNSGLIYHLTVEPMQLQDQNRQPLISMYKATITAKGKPGSAMEDRSVSEMIYQP